MFIIKCEVFNNISMVIWWSRVHELVKNLQIIKLTGSGRLSVKRIFCIYVFTKFPLSLN